MAYMWDPGLTVGVRPIDAQHKELFQRIEELLVALRAQKGKEESTRLMDFLSDYVVQHFGAEEKLMKEHAYPKMAAHLAQHERFIALFSELKGELQAKGTTLSLALRINTEVGNWLREHILRVDRALAEFLVERSATRTKEGLEPAPQLFRV